MNSSSSQLVPSKKSKGRQKVKMAKMEKQSNLQVTFSKRRSGLFKKASELCTLCGAEAAFVVFSPADKVYCFGHPNANTVLDRLAAEGGNNGADHLAMLPTAVDVRSQLLLEAHRSSTIRELNLELTQVESLLRAERRRAEEVEKVRKAGQVQQWFPGLLEEYSFEQLCALKEGLMGFKNKFEEKVQKDMLRLNSNPMISDFSNYVNNPPIHNAGGIGENPNPTRVFPSLGSNDFSSYGQGSIGYRNNGLYGTSGGANMNSPVDGHAPNDPSDDDEW